MKLDGMGCEDDMECVTETCSKMEHVNSVGMPGWDNLFESALDTLGGFCGPEIMPTIAMPSLPSGVPEPMTYSPMLGADMSLPEGADKGCCCKELEVLHGKLADPPCKVICVLEPDPQCPEDLFSNMGDGGVLPNGERDGGGGGSPSRGTW